MQHRTGRALPSNDLSRALACAGAIALVLLSGCGGVTPEQKAVIAKVQGFGGKVSFEGGGYVIDLAGTPVQDHDLEDLKTLGTISEITLTGTKVTDKGLSYLDPITTLVQLNLERTLISHEAADKFKAAHPELTLIH